MSFFGLVGKDEAAIELAKIMRTFSVDAQLVAKAELNTIIKLRIPSWHQQLIRLDQEKDFSLVDCSGLLANILLSLDQTELVILSD